jgi:hypothetical protein
VAPGTDWEGTAVTVLTALDLPPRPRRSRLQELAFERALAIRHGNQDRAREIELYLAKQELLAAVDRYRARTGGHADRQFATRVSNQLVYGA